MKNSFFKKIIALFLCLALLPVSFSQTVEMEKTLPIIAAEDDGGCDGGCPPPPDDAAADELADD